MSRQAETLLNLCNVVLCGFWTTIAFSGLPWRSALITYFIGEAQETFDSWLCSFDKQSSSFPIPWQWDLQEYEYVARVGAHLYMQLSIKILVAKYPQEVTGSIQPVLLYCKMWHCRLFSRRFILDLPWISCRKIWPLVLKLSLKEPL